MVGQRVDPLKSCLVVSLRFAPFLARRAFPLRARACLALVNFPSSLFPPFLVPDTQATRPLESLFNSKGTSRGISHSRLVIRVKYSIF